MARRTAEAYLRVIAEITRARKTPRMNLKARPGLTKWPLSPERTMSGIELGICGFRLSNFGCADEE